MYGSAGHCKREQSDADCDKQQRLYTSALLVTLCGEEVSVGGEARNHTRQTCQGHSVQASVRMGTVPYPSYLPPS